MNFKILSEKWCNLSDGASVVIVTDNERYCLAEEMAQDIGEHCRIINFDAGQDFMAELRELAAVDLVIALFSFNAYVKGGANRFFSPFKKPDGITAKYSFIRLGISKNSLLQGLGTSKKLVYNKIAELNKYKTGSRLHVSSAAGTDIDLTVNGFSTCSHEITADGEMAFLPPSEISAEVVRGSAQGKIAVDVTIGQLYHYSEFLGSFGLVRGRAELIIENGMVNEIIGDEMALELREKLFALPSECRELVELGHGLSQMSPTGLIGVDESIIHTCHFGIGDGGKCGVHLDVVVNKPIITKK